MTKLKRMSMKEYFAKTLSEESLREVKIEYTLAKIAGRAHCAKEESGLSFREIAKGMGKKSTAMVQQIVNEAEPHNITVANLVRYSLACGYELNVEFRPPNTYASWGTAAQTASRFVSTYTNDITFKTIAGSSQESRLELKEAYQFLSAPGGIVGNQQGRKDQTDALVN